MKIVDILKGLFQGKKKGKRIYLDYAAATPVAPEVYSAMKPYFSEIFGNAGAVHAEGLSAKKAIDSARSIVSKILEIRENDVVFTSCGTESNNLAIYGTIRNLNEHGVANADIEIISLKTEHPSTLRALEHVASMGVVVQYAEITEEGLIHESHFLSLLSEKTALVTFAYANSEVGVVQQVKRITRMIRKYNTQHSTNILVHLDASQAPLYLPIQMGMLGVDLMTLDAGKCYGPKGVGVLAYRHGVPLKSIMLGGDQEHGLRAGTENTALIVGCAKALELAQVSHASRSVALATLRDDMITKILRKIEGSVLNGSPEHRIANNVNVSIPGIDSEFAVVTLDTHGIAASTRSACSGADGEVSYVVEEMTKDPERAKATIRFSLGEATTQQDIDTAVIELSEHVAKIREFQRSLT